MTRGNSIDRRRFLAAAGVGALGGLARPAVAQDTLKIRRQAEIPYKPDVLVVGGGPAGIGAALGSAASGATTLLIEHHAFLGGVAAWCLGMPMNQMRPGNKPRSKLHELLLAKLRAYGEQAVRVGEHQLWCNVDYLKVAVLDALDEVGCQYLVHTRAIDAVVENNRITGVVVATKRGPAVIRAKAIVDCTGDADVAYCAGAETMKEVGSLSPMTLCLNLTNVTREQLRKANIRDIARKAKKKYPLIPNGWGLGKFTYYWRRTREGWYMLSRRTSAKRFRRACRAMNEWLRYVRNWHETKEWWLMLATKLRGHYQYYGVSGNSRMLKVFRYQVMRMVHKWLNRRSQRNRWSWKRFTEYSEHYPLPVPHIVHKFY